MLVVDLVGGRDLVGVKFKVKKTDDARRHPLRNTQGDV